MRKQLSQQKLMEILCHEIDVLQETSKNINEVAPEIARQLEKLKTTGVKAELDTGHLERLLKNHEKELNSKSVIPKLFLWTMWVMVVIIIAQGLWLFQFLSIK
jgi:hypothetical protein